MGKILVKVNADLKYNFMQMLNLKISLYFILMPHEQLNLFLKKTCTGECWIFYVPIHLTTHRKQSFQYMMTK